MTSTTICINEDEERVVTAQLRHLQRRTCAANPWNKIAVRLLRKLTNARRQMK